MMNEPNVSIILTTFNRSKLLKRAVVSVLKQQYSNFILHIVDDASTDNTEEIVKSLQMKDKRIKYHRHAENLGLPSARNTGLNASEGKYIAFMDDDDEWIDNNKLKKQVHILEKDQNNKIGIVCCSVRIIKNDTKYDKVIEKPISIKETLLKGNGIIFTSTVLARRNVFIDVGGFDLQFSRGIDSDIYRRVIFKGYDVYFMKDIMVNYFEIGDDRITKTDTIEKLKAKIINFEQILKKYPNEFRMHPKSMADRYYNLAVMNYKMYVLTNNNSYNKNAQSYLKSSIKLDIRNSTIKFLLVMKLPGVKHYYNKRVKKQYIVQ